MRLIPTQELISEGIPQRRIQRLVHAGSLSRARRGIYIEGSPPVDLPDQHMLRLVAALRLAGTGVVASHWSAAALWELPIPRQMLQTVWLTTSGPGGGYLRDGIRRHRSVLTPDDLAEAGGVRCTALARTCADLARSTSFEQGVILTDAALHLGLERSALTDRLDAAAGRPGIGVARAVAEFADGLAESPMESVTRVAIARAGVPMPELQRNIFDEFGRWIARVDFCWDDCRLVGEYDGMDKYDRETSLRRADALIAEKARDAKLREAGWTVVHWTKADLADREAFGRRLRQSLATARRARER